MWYPRLATRSEHEQELKEVAMNEQQEMTSDLPKKTNSKLFYVSASERLIVGIDHEGYVWSRPAMEGEAEWKCLGRPGSN